MSTFWPTCSIDRFHNSEWTNFGYNGVITNLPKLETKSSNINQIRNRWRSEAWAATLRNKKWARFEKMAETEYFYGHLKLTWNILSSL